MGDHLLVMHSAVRACAGYDRHEAPSILIDGSSLARDTEHGRAVTSQLTRRHGTLEEAIDAGVFGLGAAGLSKGIRRQARAACEDYFDNRLGLEASPVERPGRVAEGLELMPDGMQRVLEDIIELIVDGDYEELRVLSRDRLEVEDLRRRVEDDCPEALVLPPRELYRVEAITKSDDPAVPGWAFFLDLWTETGPARLHRRRVKESDERYTATLTTSCLINAESPPVGGLSAIRRSGGFRGKGTFIEGLALWLPSLSDPLQSSVPPVSRR